MIIRKNNFFTSIIRKSMWLDSIGVVLALCVAILVVAVAETDRTAEWISRHRDSKIDEAITVGVVGLLGFIALVVFGCRKMYRAIMSADSVTESGVPEAQQIRASLRRDILMFCCVLALAILSVPVFDTGSLAEWIGRHKDTKIDEIIVAAMLLLVGGGFFSVRRWLELSQQLILCETLYSGTRELNRRSSVLGNLVGLLQSCASAEDAQMLIAEHGRQLFPNSSGALCLINNSRNFLEVAGTWGSPIVKESQFEIDRCWSLRRGQVHAFDIDSAALRCPHWQDANLARAICVPLVAHGDTLGILCVELGAGDSSTSNWQRIVGSEEELAKTLGEHSALAISNLRMREMLKFQTTRDPLTGLFNRRFMMESLDRELQRALRKGTSLAVMMIDVDHFKTFNDAHGHEMGDSVLRALASLFTSVLRGSDIISRYGGEEFAVIMPDATLTDAERRAEQLRRAVSFAEIDSQMRELRVTISVGVSAFPEVAPEQKELLRSADMALYAAKNAGRNRVQLASGRRP